MAESTIEKPKLIEYSRDDTNCCPHIIKEGTPLSKDLPLNFSFTEEHIEISDVESTIVKVEHNGNDDPEISKDVIEEDAIGCGVIHKKEVSLIATEVDGQWLLTWQVGQQKNGDFVALCFEVDIPLFISLVENYRHLYDLRRKDFKDTQKKDCSWAEISSVLDLSVEECKKLWKSLRDTYVRKKKQEPSGSEGGSQKQWAYSKIMSFYDACISKRRTLSSLQSTSQVKSKADSDVHNTWSSMSRILSPTGSESLSIGSTLSEEETDSRIERSSERASSSLLMQQPFKESERSALPSTSTKNVEASFQSRKRDNEDTHQDEQLYKRKRTNKDKHVGEIIGLAEKLVSSIEDKKVENPVNATFAKYVAFRLDELPAETAMEKRQRIVQILES